MRTWRWTKWACMGMMMSWIGYRPKSPRRARTVSVRVDGLKTGEAYPYERVAMGYKAS